MSDTFFVAAGASGLALAGERFTGSATSSDSGTEHIDMSDLRPMTDQQASEHVFWQYRMHRRRWRRLTGKPVRRFRRHVRHFVKRRGKGKGRSQGGFGFGGFRRRSYVVTQDDIRVLPWKSWNRIRMWLWERTWPEAEPKRKRRNDHDVQNLQVRRALCSPLSSRKRRWQRIWSTISYIPHGRKPAGCRPTYMARNEP